MDRAEANMIDADTKMKLFLKKSSQWYLWLIIAVELVILIVVFFVL